MELQLKEARAAYEAAQRIEDVNERRRLSAIPLRDVRYFVKRIRTAQIVPNPSSAESVSFGSAELRYCTHAFGVSIEQLQKVIEKTGIRWTLAKAANDVG